MTLLDVVMAHAARRSGAQPVEEAIGVVTVEMKTTFMRPGVGRGRRRAIPVENPFVAILDGNVPVHGHNPSAGPASSIRTA